MVLACAALSCSTPAQREGVVELFNGRNLAGWSYVSADPSVPQSEVWSVEDGVLTCAGTPIGFVHRGPSVQDFRMVVEYRWKPGTTPGNSGIFSRIQEPLKPLPNTVEVQLMHGNAGDTLGLQGKQVSAEQPRFFSVKKHALAGDIAGVRKMLDMEKPPGQWNRVEIVAVGPRYTVWINGELVNQVEGVEVSAGTVGLQSEGGIIQFRRVTLAPLGR